MKFTTSFLVASILVAHVAALPSLDLRQAGKAVANTGKGKGNSAAGTAAGAKGAAANGKGAAAKNGAKGAAAKGGKGGKDAAAAKGKGANAGKDANAGTNANAGADAAAAKAAKGGKGGDLQTSLTLDPSVIAKGFANNGQDVPAAGQVASLTSTNNFINFCATVKQLPITNGKQIATGSCNPAPMGVIPSSDQMPSSKFTNPTNMANIGENTPFTITMAISKFEAGNFVNAQANYFSAPQQVNGAGQIKGHSHVVVEKLTSLDQTTPTDPKKFAFFKGLNDKAKGGVLSAAVDKGLPAGVYRLASINTAANHQPALVPIAQHGSLDDAVYFTVGKAAGDAAAKVAGGKAAAADAKGAAAGAKGAADAKGAAGAKGAADATGAAAKGGKDAAKGAAAKGAAAKGGKNAAGGNGGKAAAGGNGGKAGKQAAGKTAGKGKVRRFARESY